MEPITTEEARAKYCQGSGCMAWKAHRIAEITVIDANDDARRISESRSRQFAKHGFFFKPASPSIQAVWTKPSDNSRGYCGMVPK